MKIVSAQISGLPRPMPEGMFDPMPNVSVEYEDGSKEKLFEFYPDEISFLESEIVELTREQVLTLKHQKDQAYLRS